MDDFVWHRMTGNEVTSGGEQGPDVDHQNDAEGHFLIAQGADGTQGFLKTRIVSPPYSATSTPRSAFASGTSSR